MTQTQSLPIKVSPLSNERYENIFNVYSITKKPENVYYYYNLLNKIILPEQLSTVATTTFTVTTKTPWTLLSYKLYGSQFLWWLVFILNNPKNIFYAEPDVEYRCILPGYVSYVLNNIQTQLGYGNS